MCELMVQDTDWLMVDQWAPTFARNAKQAKTNIEKVVCQCKIPQAKTPKKAKLFSHTKGKYFPSLPTDYGTKIRVLNVCGVDGILTIKAASVYKEGIIMVLNRKLNFNFEEIFAQHPHKVFFFFM
jgi:hypothetical protein